MEPVEPTWNGQKVVECSGLDEGGAGSQQGLCNERKEMTSEDCLAQLSNEGGTWPEDSRGLRSPDTLPGSLNF